MSYPTYPKNITDAWNDFGWTRNQNINCNYVWNEVGQYWTPQQGASASGAVSAGDISTLAKRSIHKFGNNPSISNTVSTTSPETIWDGSSEYVFPPNVGTGIQIKSSEGSDSQEFIVQGLDENFKDQSWTGNLNGVSDVNIEGSWSRVFRSFNNDSTPISGNINIHASGDAATSYAQVLAGNDQTLMALYTVPSDCTGYLVGYHSTAYNPSSASEINYTIQLKTREYGKVFRVQEIFSVNTSNGISQNLPFPNRLEPKTDILFNVVSANGNNGAVNADFDVALV